VQFRLNRVEKFIGRIAGELEEPPGKGPGLDEFHANMYTTMW